MCNSYDMAAGHSVSDQAAGGMGMNSSMTGQRVMPVGVIDVGVDLQRGADPDVAEDGQGVVGRDPQVLQPRGEGMPRMVETLMVRSLLVSQIRRKDRMRLRGSTGRLFTGLLRQPRLGRRQLHWSRWRRRHQATARKCHYQRREALAVT